MGRLPPPKVIERPVLVRWGEQDAYPGSLIAELKAQPNPKLVLYSRGLGKLWAGGYHGDSGVWQAPQRRGAVLREGNRLQLAEVQLITRGTTRDNINGSQLSFGSLLDFPLSPLGPQNTVRCTRTVTSTSAYSPPSSARPRST